MARATLYRGDDAGVWTLRDDDRLTQRLMKYVEGDIFHGGFLTLESLMKEMRERTVFLFQEQGQAEGGKATFLARLEAIGKLNKFDAAEGNSFRAYLAMGLLEIVVEEIRRRLDEEQSPDEEQRSDP